ncbi:hypothetical protein BH23CHL5_BH23CHL5_04910 [soil metagenome]
MTADFNTAEHAAAFGVVNVVTNDDELLATAMQSASKIRRRAPLAVQMAKQLVDDGLQFSLAPAITMEMRMTPTHYETNDAREGFAAFLEKRSPEFTGR